MKIGQNVKRNKDLVGNNQVIFYARKHKIVQ